MSENLELREWIAVNVMGFRKAHDGAWIMPRTVDAEGAETAGAQWTLPRYELTWNDAALVVEAMRARGWFVEVTARPAPYNDAEVVLCKGFDRRRRPVMPEHYSHAPTAPRAICLAAKAATEATR